jgi:metal-responsive CopG/Arc/MetJ family transcriptional regulator
MIQSQTFNISLPKKLVKIMDQVAKNQFSSRSDLIRTAVISYVSKNQKLLELYSYAEAKAKELNIKEDDIEDIIDDYRTGKQ